MSWAFRRQLTVLLIIFLFLGGFTALFFWLRKPALSCFDNLKNQNEEGIDCGGPCDLFCPNAVNDLVVKWSRVLAVRAGQFDAVASIENQNPTAGLSDFEYTFRLYDANNKPVAERSGHTLLNPGEKFVIYEPNIDTGHSVPVKAYVDIKKPYGGFIWKKVKSVGADHPNLSVRTKQFDSTSVSRAMATIANDSLTDGKAINIVAVLYDDGGNVIGASSTYLDVIKGASELPVVFTWPNPFETPPAAFEMYLHYDQGIGALQ